MGVSRTELLRLNRPSLTIYGQPKGIDISEWTPHSARERCVAIVVRPEYLLSNFIGSSLEGFTRLQEFLTAAEGKFQYLQFPLSAQIFELADKLVKNPYIGNLGLMFTQPLTLPLLCSAVASSVSLSGFPPAHST